MCAPEVAQHSHTGGNPEPDSHVPDAVGRLEWGRKRDLGRFVVKALCAGRRPHQRYVARRQHPADAVAGPRVEDLVAVVEQRPAARVPRWRIAAAGVILVPARGRGRPQEARGGEPAVVADGVRQSTFEDRESGAEANESGLEMEDAGEQVNRMLIYEVKLASARKALPFPPSS